MLPGVEWTHLSIPGQVDLQCFSVILKAKRCHRKEDIFAIDRLSLFLLALL